jgi:hypothetical protein
MASFGSVAYIAHVTGGTSSESATSIRSAPTARRALTRTRRHWTTAAVVIPANMQSELDRFGPLCKSETKAGKTYLKCKLHNRFCKNLILNRVQVDEQDRTSRSRTEQDEQEEQDRAGQYAGQDRTGRAQVRRSDDLDHDLVASLELKTNQSGSGFI